MDDGDTEIDAVVWFPFHRYVPPDVVSVTLLPEQIIPSLLLVPKASVALIEGVGSAFTVTALVAVAEQLFASVTVTV